MAAGDLPGDDAGVFPDHPGGDFGRARDRGLWTAEVWRLYALSLPLIALAVVLGRVLNRRIPTDRFTRFVDLALIGLGVLLLF